MTKPAISGLRLMSWKGLLLVAYVAGCAGAPPSVRSTLPHVVFGDDCRRDVRVDLPWHTDSGSPGPDSSHIRVRVSEMSGLHRVGGVSVLLLMNGTRIAETLTNSSGEARLQVKAGTYRLEFRLIGYQLTWSEVTLLPRWAEFSEVPLWIQPVC
jgi:hypothetical protein